MTILQTSDGVYVPTTIPFVDSGVMTIQTSTPVSNATSFDTIWTLLPMLNVSLTSVSQWANSTIIMDTSTPASTLQTTPISGPSQTTGVSSVGPSTLVVTRTLSKTTSSTTSASASASTTPALVNAGGKVSNASVLGLTVALGVLLFGY